MDKNKATLLIVDDMPENIYVLAKILEDEYNIKIAINGEVALEIAPSVDMILLDIVMPNMDGYEVCKRLKADPQTKEIPVIFVTSLDGEQDEEKGLALGAVDYLFKPIKPSITKARIKTHLAFYNQNRYLEERVKIETQKRLEQQNELIRQSRLAAMGEMMSAITHQWKQPLNTISLTSSLIHFMVEMGKIKKEELNEKLTIIDETVALMSNTLVDLKEYFSPKKIKKEFNVTDEIKKILQMFSSQFNDTAIKVKIDLDPDIKGYGVAGEFMQVILNVLSNAKDAIVAKKINDGLITIHGNEKDGMTSLEITDNGIGVDPSIIHHIFNDYFTTKGEKGTGIGLSLSRMIIEEEMGGTIYASSSSEGTTIFFTFRAKEPTK